MENIHPNLKKAINDYFDSFVTINCKEGQKRFNRMMYCARRNKINYNKCKEFYEKGLTK